MSTYDPLGAPPSPDPDSNYDPFGGPPCHDTDRGSIHEGGSLWVVPAIILSLAIMWAFFVDFDGDSTSSKESTAAEELLQ